MMTMAGSDPERIRLEEEVGYNWEELGRLARRLEKDLDEQLLGLGQLVARNAPCHEDQLAGLEKTLRTLSSVINMMDELLEGLGTGVSNERSKAGVSAAHLLNRHRELLQEYGRDFRKVKGQIVRNREQAELLTSVREEIQAATKPSSTTTFKQTGKLSPALERDRVDRYGHQTDTILDIAQGVHTGLLHQKTALQSVWSRLQSVAERFPLVNQIMMKVRLRRRKDQLILGAFIGVCLFLFFIL